MPDYISKFFRVAVEGDTVDGRSLSRDDIEAMGKNYDPELYGARVWIEHIRSILPTSPFKAYGDILATKSEQIKNGALKGKLALYAQIKPLDDLIEINKEGQKIYSSVEIHPNFSQTGSAYLMGLAVTDSPASVGTEILKFSIEKQQPEHILLTNDEPLELEFAPIKKEEKKNSLTETIANIFKKQGEKAGNHFKDMKSAITNIANEVVALNKTVDKKANQDDFDELKQQFNDLKSTLEKEEKPNNYNRQKATGADGSESTTRY